MSYLLRANHFTQNLTVEANLISYFESVPQSFWQALDRIDANTPINFPVSSQGHTNEQLIDHQLFLLEKSASVPDIMRRDNLLTRLGYDTIELRLGGTYDAQAQTLNEDGVLNTVWSFTKNMVADEDPAVMGLNILQLVLDLIGLVPFSWGALPIDVVANAISGIISAIRGNFISAALSILMCIDVSKASAFIAATFKPAARYIEPVLKLLLRPSGVAVFDLQKGISAMKEGVIKIGGKSLLENVIALFKNIGKFFVDILSNVLETSMKLITSVFQKVPIVSKYTEKVITGIEKLRLSTRAMGANVDQAVNLLTRTGTVADKAAATGLVSTITAEIKGGQTYAKIIEKQRAGKISKDWADVYLKHKIQNKLVGEPQMIMNAIERELAKDPAKAAAFMTQFGVKPTGQVFQKLVKAGDERGVRHMIDALTNNAEIKKLLSPRELEALNVFKRNPKALIDGTKDFEALSNKLIEIENKVAVKGNTAFLNSRIRPLRRLTYFILNMLWKRYGSATCIFRAMTGGKSEGATDLIRTSSALAAATVPVTEAEAPAAIPTEEIEAAIFTKDPTPEQMDELQRTDPETHGEIKKAMDETAANKTKLQELNKKDDCRLQATLVNAMLPNYIPYKSGLGMGALPYNYDKAAQDKFHKNVEDYNKQVLDSLGLGSTIDVQHSLDNSDPVTRAYFSDVFDYQNGYVKVTPEQFESSRERVIAEMVKSGEITQQTANEIRAKLQESDRTGKEPVEVTQAMDRLAGSTGQDGSVKESLFKVKYLNK